VALTATRSLCSSSTIPLRPLDHEEVLLDHPPHPAGVLGALAHRVLPARRAILEWAWLRLVVLEWAWLRPLHRDHPAVMHLRRRTRGLATRHLRRCQGGCKLRRDLHRRIILLGHRIPRLQSERRPVEVTVHHHQEITVLLLLRDRRREVETTVLPLLKDRRREVEITVHHHREITVLPLLRDHRRELLPCHHLLGELFHVLHCRRLLHPVAVSSTHLLLLAVLRVGLLHPLAAACPRRRPQTIGSQVTWYT
jgi:hypothetical protein